MFAPWRWDEKILDSYSNLLEYNEIFLRTREATLFLALQGPEPHFPLKGKHISAKVGETLWSSFSIYRVLNYLPKACSGSQVFSRTYSEIPNSAETQKYFLYTPHC